MADGKYCIACGSATTPAVVDGRERRRCGGCGWLFLGLPDPVVLVLAVTPGGRVALTRDQRFPPGKWGLVAGYIERGERPEDAALRELREETGLAGTDAQVICGDSYGDNVIFCVRCRIPDAEPQPERGTEVELAHVDLARIVPDSPASRLVATLLQ